MHVGEQPSQVISVFYTYPINVQNIFLGPYF